MLQSANIAKNCRLNTSNFYITIWECGICCGTQAQLRPEVARFYFLRPPEISAQGLTAIHWGKDLVDANEPVLGGVRLFQVLQVEVLVTDFDIPHTIEAVRLV